MSSDLSPDPDGVEMSTAIRAFDWSETSLGPREGWPTRLTATVDVMLSAGARMAVLWDEDLLLLYNDGYRTLIGAKHPRALGRPTREVFSEVWDTVGPMFARVFAEGRPAEAHDQLLPLDRGAGVEDAWFDYTVNPIPLDDGSTGGVLVIAVEVTERVRAARELRRLNQTLEQRVRERTGLIEGITQGTEDMIAAEDADFRYLFFNDAYRREFAKLWGGQQIEVGTSMVEALAPWPEEQRKARDIWAARTSSWRCWATSCVTPWRRSAARRTSSSSRSPRTRTCNAPPRSSSDRRSTWPG